MPKLVKTVKAKEDLLNIWQYTFRQWGESQADFYLDDLESAISRLAETPLICRERDEFSPPMRIHIHSHHLVVYQCIDGGIRVVRILHKSMNIDGQLEELDA